MYYASKFNLTFGLCKKTWDITKIFTTGYDHVNSQNITEIRVDNNIITDSNIIANIFNSFFSNVGPIPISKTHGDILDYMSGNSLKIMGITDTNGDEIIGIVNLLKSSFSKELTTFSSRATKKVINDLYFLLSIIFNKSFELGQFPDKLKIAKIAPIFKSEDKLLINNYRPISIRPFSLKFLNV